MLYCIAAHFVRHDREGPEAIARFGPFFCCRIPTVPFFYIFASDKQEYNFYMRLNYRQIF